MGITKKGHGEKSNLVLSPWLSVPSVVNLSCGFLSASFAISAVKILDVLP
jgi:hypothetical protein